MYTIKVFRTRNISEKPILIRHKNTINEAMDFINKVYSFRPYYFCVYLNDSNLKHFYAKNRRLTK